MSDLQFRPPSEQLIRDYINRPQPEEVASQGIQQGLQTYMAVKQRQQEQQEKALNSYVTAYGAGGPQFAKDIAARSGLINPPSLPGGTTSQVQTPVPQVTPVTPNEDQSQQSLPDEHPKGSTVTSSPIVDHWNQTKGMGGAGPSAAVPGTENPEDFLNQGDYGKKRLATAESLGKYRETMTSAQEKEAAKRLPFDDVTTTFEAANEKAIGDKLIADAKKSGMDYVPREKLDLALRGLGVKNTGIRGGAIDSMAATRADALRQSLNSDASKVLNPLFQSGEGKSQMTILNRVGRAEPLIQQMMSQAGGGDKRQMRELASSIDRVIRGAGPSAQSQIDELIPDTARGKFANWQEFYTSNPTGTEQKAFIQRYADTLAREKTTVQGQIRNMAEMNAPTLRVLKEKYPNDYRAHLDSVINNKQLTGPPMVSSQDQYDALPSGADYVSADGRPHRKK